MDTRAIRKSILKALVLAFIVSSSTTLGDYTGKKGGAAPHGALRAATVIVEKSHGALGHGEDGHSLNQLAEGTVNGIITAGVGNGFDHGSTAIQGASSILHGQSAGYGGAHLGGGGAGVLLGAGKGLGFGNVGYGNDLVHGSGGIKGGLHGSGGALLAGGYGHGNEYYPPAKYEFSYGVNDPYYGTNFGHSEQRDGYNAKGEYYVQLPDGRLQRVTYYTDEWGYHPTVTYEGTAQYPPPQSYGGHGGHLGGLGATGGLGGGHGAYGGQVGGLGAVNGGLVGGPGLHGGHLEGHGGIVGGPGVHGGIVGGFGGNGVLGGIIDGHGAIGPIGGLGAHGGGSVIQLGGKGGGYHR